MEPAITASQDTWFNITVRTSSVADVELTCGRSRSGTLVVELGEEVVGDMINLYIITSAASDSNKGY
jgi:hypothetical protein